MRDRIPSVIGANGEVVSNDIEVRFLVLDIAEAAITAQAAQEALAISPAHRLACPVVGGWHVSSCGARSHDYKFGHDVSINVPLGQTQAVTHVLHKADDDAPWTQMAPERPGHHRTLKPWFIVSCDLCMWCLLPMLSSGVCVSHLCGGK